MVTEAQGPGLRVQEDMRRGGGGGLAAAAAGRDRNFRAGGEDRPFRTGGRFAVRGNDAE
jgi:hypothetical protein